MLIIAVIIATAVVLPLARFPVPGYVSRSLPEHQGAGIFVWREKYTILSCIKILFGGMGIWAVWASVDIARMFGVIFYCMPCWIMLVGGVMLAGREKIIIVEKIARRVIVKERKWFTRNSALYGYDKCEIEAGAAGFPFVYKSQIFVLLNFDGKRIALFSSDAIEDVRQYASKWHVETGMRLRNVGCLR